ncbi:MAG: GNAT family N-acetyltransferase [Clostridia bacterium]|nr:GNAT family N-acetyltransferase [Clostridia bacterium]
MIRKAGTEDAAAIAALSLQELGYDYPLEKTAQALRDALADDSQTVLVCVEDGEVCGYVHTQLYRTLYSDRYMNVLGIAVKSALRRRGFGCALLTAAEDDAKLRGCSGVRLVSGEERSEAHAFYEAMGYKRAKRQLNLKKTWEKACLFR